MEIMKQWIPQNNLFEQHGHARVLSSWSSGYYWLIVVFSQSTHNWHRYVYAASHTHSFLSFLDSNDLCIPWLTFWDKWKNVLENLVLFLGKSDQNHKDEWWGHIVSKSKENWKFSFSLFYLSPSQLKTDSLI